MKACSSTSHSIFSSEINNCSTNLVLFSFSGSAAEGKPIALV
jgi:hypothetical protein